MMMIDDDEQEVMQATTALGGFIVDVQHNQDGEQELSNVGKGIVSSVCVSF